MQPSERPCRDLGWNADNSRTDIRFGVGNDELRKKAEELVELAPDVVFAVAPPSVLAVQKASRTVPIVFAAVTDPVGLGIVEDLARPGGHATGFLSAEFGFGAKWLELLKEVVPSLRKVIVVYGPRQPECSRTVRCNTSCGIHNRGRTAFAKIE